MTGIAWATTEDFFAAVEAAESEKKRVGSGDLWAPLGATGEGQVTKAWNWIKKALGEVWAEGRNFADVAAEQTLQRVKEIIEGAGAGARAVQEEVVRRVQAYIQEIIDRTLARVRETVTVGGQELRLQGLDLAQGVIVTGSLGLSIHEAFKLTGEGQMTVTARYGIAAENVS
jgi:hypothetical protein